MARILIINGPNMNLLGVREPELYGREDYAALVRLCEETCSARGASCECFQSNHEGAIIDKIQEARLTADGIVINAAGYSHTSVAILDALKAAGLPAVEVHVTDPAKREAYRRFSYVREACFATVARKGIAGYREAIELLLKLLEEQGAK